jgi:cytochrome b
VVGSQSGFQLGRHFDDGAGLFLTSFVIAKTIDDDSPYYSFHMLSGMILGLTVALRIIWGFWGSKHSRFSGMSLNPKSLISYFKGILSGDKRRWSGHNPASSWAGILMMFFALGLGVTGYLMVSGSNKEAFEDLHELFANAFVIVAILHVAGIVLHTVRHKEMIGLSMIDGKKADIPSSDEIPSPKSDAGIIFIGLVVAFGLYLFKNFDTQNQRLQVFGTTLQLGETESNEGASKTEVHDDDEGDKD